MTRGIQPCAVNICTRLPISALGLCRACHEDRSLNTAKSFPIWMEERAEVLLGQRSLWPYWR